MMAKALAANGAYKVYILGRRREVLEEAAAACPTGNIIPLPGDVSSKKSLEQIAARVKSEVGFINLLIANSGIGGPSVPRLPEGTSITEFVKGMWEIPMSDFTQTFEVNVTGVLYTALAFLELLDAGNEMGNLDEKITSQVIGMSSIAGFNRSAGAGFAYNSSKAACTHLMKMLATYLVPWNIRCNVLAPGSECIVHDPCRLMRGAH
jgi:NAD(P)-dependent dehydrogenase (short-subunit alcohol dehydrogenase family)